MRIVATTRRPASISSRTSCRTLPDAPAPRRLRTCRRRSVGVARGDIPRNAGAFCEIAPDREIGGGCARAIALLESAKATVEARYQPLTPLAARRLGIDQRLHLVAPGLPLLGAANLPQVVQRAEDLGEALQLGLVRRP